MISGQESRTIIASREPSVSLLFTMGAIFPGAGQFVQKRWGSGIVYALSSVATLVGFLVYMLRFFCILQPDLLGRERDWCCYSLATCIEDAHLPRCDDSDLDCFGC